MDKKEWLMTLVPLSLVIFLDQFSKILALDLKESVSFIFLHLKLALNQGLILGFFADLSNLLRVVSLSTGGVFIFVLYLLIQFLLLSSSVLLRVGMSLFVGGILGNVIDRIRWGFVVDFLVVGTENFHSAIFNLADFFQVIGFLLILYAFIKEGDLLWPEKEDRKTYWINKKFQLKYSLILMGVGAGLGLITLTFCYTFFRITLIELDSVSSLIRDKTLLTFVVVYSLICLTFCLSLFLFGKIISHRIAGPLYAFERFLDNILDGKKSELKLRSGDDFKHLEEISIRIQEKLENIKLQ